MKTGRRRKRKKNTKKKKEEDLETLAAVKSNETKNHPKRRGNAEAEKEGYTLYNRSDKKKGGEYTQQMRHVKRKRKKGAQTGRGIFS